MKDRIIDQSLIDYLALDLSITTFIGSDKTIVPKELRHLFILENHDVGTSTSEYYYTPSSRFISDKEFQSLVRIGFAGKKETSFDPYPFIFYGAYVSRNDLLVKLIMHNKNRIMTYKGKEINVFGDLYPYYEDYAIGFKSGFENFENEHIVPYTNFFNQDSAKINKVFEYVTKEIWFKYSWYNNHRGFKTKTSSSLSSPKEYEIIEAYEEGKGQGYYYKAWSIILSNKDIFEPLFEELDKKNIITEININELNVPDWAVIFYYSHHAKALPDAANLSEKMKVFIKQNNITATFNSFKNNFYEVRKRINDLSNYPIKKIEKIMPILNKYPNATQLAENDIKYLKEEAKNKE